MDKHLFLVEDENARNEALAAAGITEHGDMLGLAAAAAVEELVGSWAGSLPFGFDGTPEELRGDIEGVRAAVNAALARLAAFVVANPVRR